MAGHSDDAAGLASEFAGLAQVGEWDAAVELGLRQFGGQKPDPGLFIRVSELLVKAQEVDAAEAYLQEGNIRWPTDRSLLWHYAELATRHRSFELALGRWEKLIALHPELPLGPCGLAGMYRKFGREDDAARLFADAAARYPDFLWAACGDAWSWTRRHDWPEAARRWADVCERFPDQRIPYEELVHALTAGGRLAEAEEAARRGLAEFPKSDRLAAALTRIEERMHKVGRRSTETSDVVPDLTFRCPTDLAVSPTPLKRVVIIGSCLVGGMPRSFESASPGLSADFLLFNNGSVLPESPPYPPETYDFQFIQIPFRSVLPDISYFRMSYVNPDAYSRLFDEACDRMSMMLSQAMRWNREHGMLAFVCNFLVPQQNPMGRLLPRHDLRNFVYFVEKLNEALGQELKSYRNAYLFDQDQIAATYGRKTLQDDVLWTISHGGAFGSNDFRYDQNRLEPILPVTAYYPTTVGTFVRLVWAELQAMYRTIRQTDMVKLVLLDLDDTLWRGVVAEEEKIPVREGWPIGLAEALLFLKQRGVLLGIVSKNDESRVAGLWKRIYGKYLRPDDFAVRKINWRPKADNIEEILAEVNLLPRSVIFIDDNPVERASVKAAFPEMRVLGSNPYLWRRILLWSPETQVPAITAESAVRTEMVQAQVQREGQRKQMSREEFLASLGVRASLTEVHSGADPQFPRTLELINKTNQFNTTGRRWSSQELTRVFEGGGRLFTLTVADKFTAYGIVGVMVVQQDEIIQFVMSCRTVGMDVEIAAVSAALATMVQDGCSQAVTTLVETPANLLCRDLWERCGFVAIGSGHFVRQPIGELVVPPHITVTVGAEEPSLLAAAE